MNREELISEIAKRTGEYKRLIREVVNTYEDIVKERLTDGEDVHLHGFVSFFVMEHETKRYVNPHTGEEQILAPRMRAKAKVSESWADMSSTPSAS